MKFMMSFPTPLPAPKTIGTPLQHGTRARRTGAALLAISVLNTPAHASFLHGEMLDKVADIMSWVVIVLTPIFGIVTFCLVHILPEKVAMKRKHPQAQAIQVLCLLSLFFGGLLWPLAWLWAYSKPVMYKLAYGTDVAEGHDHGESGKKTEQGRQQ